MKNKIIILSSAIIIITLYLALRFTSEFFPEHSFLLGFTAGVVALTIINTLIQLLDN